MAVSGAILLIWLEAGGYMNKLGLSLSSALLGLSFSASAAPIVELFTSQGCYSCPPADEHLGDIIKNNPEVVALEYHVDYWDQLVYGSAGVWKDPFSDPAYTVRQRLYNQIFDRLQVTDVPTGENHGKTMVNHHVVRELVPLGRWGGDTVSASFPIAANMHSPGGEGSGCAVLLQDEDHGPILGASYCN